jgi:hypothetical protein
MSRSETLTFIRRSFRGVASAVLTAARLNKSGASAAALLCRLGFPPRAALDMVASAGSGPETAEQGSPAEQVAAAPDFDTLEPEIGDELEGPDAAHATVASGGGGTLVKMIEPPHEVLGTLMYATRRVLPRSGGRWVSRSAPALTVSGQTRGRVKCPHSNNTAGSRNRRIGLWSTVRAFYCSVRSFKSSVVLWCTNVPDRSIEALFILSPPIVRPF